jgi:ATP-binding cassette subfamily C (CFTR/MRP) protein 1
VVSALLRIAEPTSGKILIDGVDIHTIGLQLLRSSLSVINQDAVILAGTIRYNLDPFQQYDDDWLHQCLRRVGLAGEQPDAHKTNSKWQDSEIGSDSYELMKNNNSEFSSSRMSLGLDSEVKENGANISQGQRSLISIARALVRQSRIVILDEATASIDSRADTELQGMLNEVMGDATVITVAHRLDTIVTTCNRVIIIDSGMVAESGSIPELLSRPDSLFGRLCEAAKMTARGETC